MMEPVLSSCVLTTGVGGCVAGTLDSQAHMLYIDQIPVQYLGWGENI